MTVEELEEKMSLSEFMSWVAYVDEKIGRAHAELQSHHDLVCRLLLEKKKNKIKTNQINK